MEQENKRPDIEIRAKWDIWNSTWLTNKIFRLADEHKLKVKIEVKPGSIELWFIIDMVLRVYGLYQLVKEIQKYIERRKQRYREKKKEELPTVTIIYFDLKEKRYVKIEI